jgi:hypothetical protein
MIMAKKKASVGKTTNRIKGRLAKAKLKLAKKKSQATRIVKKTSMALRTGVTVSSIEEVAAMGEKNGYDVYFNQDYGAGSLDLVWNISFHPALTPLRCGFVQLDEQEAGTTDLEDGQFSLRKIEEAVIRGLRSGLDRLYIVCDSKELAKSIIGRIEWLSSFGSLFRFDAFSSGLFPAQKNQATIVPSQQRVPKGEKIRKKKMKERERKFEKYNRPSIEKRSRESVSDKLGREISINEYSRPKGQKKRF